MDSLSVIARDKRIREYILRVTHNNNLSDDLYGELFLVLAEMPREKIDEIVLNKQYIFFCWRIISNMWNSKTSRFYYKYRKNNHIDIDSLELDFKDEEYVDNVFDDLIEKHIQRERDECIRKKVYPYDARILEEYLAYGSLRKVESEVGIPYQAVYNSLKITKLKIYESINSSQ